ncbi:hypothetical protein CYQ88_02510 [Hydrogenovibrio sp. SC-1]|nr:hypothetical protein CYQ88_02510 [Hydrogenovibrio sp. SC-1]
MAEERFLIKLDDDMKKLILVSWVAAAISLMGCSSAEKQAEKAAQQRAAQKEYQKQAADKAHRELDREVAQ